MNNVVIERGTFSSDAMAAILLIVSVIMFYLLGNGSPILVVFLAIFCFWVGRSKPVEYFWANENGIEFHTEKEILHQVSWEEVDRIHIDGAGGNYENTWVLKIDLNIKLEKKPLYIGASGFFKTTLVLSEGNKNRKLLKQLKRLKEQ